jgi:26S proteasome regulatory subunit N5
MFDSGDWKGLEEHILMLCKRRGQLKQAVQAMVRQAMGYIGQTPDQATKISLITTLQTLTEGKVRKGASTTRKCKLNKNEDD